MGQIVGLNLELDEQMIAETVKQTANMAIAKALGDPGKIVQKAVENIMGEYVDEDGKTCRQGSYKARPYIEYIAHDIVRTTVKECIREYIEENRDGFKQAVRDCMRNNDFANRTAERYLETVLECTNGRFTMPMDIKFAVDRD